MVISSFLGSIFSNLPVGTDSTYYTNRMSVIFFGLLANFVSHQEVIPIMFHERLLFYRERGLCSVTLLLLHNLFFLGFVWFMILILLLFQFFVWLHFLAWYLIIYKFKKFYYFQHLGAKAYGAIPYWISTWIVRAPICMMNAAIFSTIFYKIIGLRDGGFSFFYFVLAAHSITASFMCQLISFCNPSPATVNKNFFLLIHIYSHI